jgi:hypothetical protein
MILYVWVSARREYRLYSLRGLGWRGRGAPIKTDREKVCRYNDDIQGTAGIGIADLIASAMTLDGLTEDQARAPISHFDTKWIAHAPVKIPDAYAGQDPAPKPFIHGAAVDQDPEGMENGERRPDSRSAGPGPGAMLLNVW